MKTNKKKKKPPSEDSFKLRLKLGSKSRKIILTILIPLSLVSATINVDLKIITNIEINSTKTHINH